jgi:hypothetical protein
VPVDDLARVRVDGRVARTAVDVHVERATGGLAAGSLGLGLAVEAGVDRVLDGVLAGHDRGELPREGLRLAGRQRAERPCADVGGLAADGALVDDPDGTLGIGEVGVGLTLGQRLDEAVAARLAERHGELGHRL